MAARHAALLVAVAALVAPCGQAFRAASRTRTRAPRLHAEAAPAGASTEAVNELLRLCAATDRCQRCSEVDRNLLHVLVKEFEQQAPPCDVLQLNGNWRLVGALGEATYRSSPFFSAFRQATSGARTPIAIPSGGVSPGDALSSAVFAITDALPFYDIGLARHTIAGLCSDELGCPVDDAAGAEEDVVGDAPSDGTGVVAPATGAGELVSRVELSIGRVFGLPAQSSVMTTSASITALRRPAVDSLSDDEAGTNPTAVDVELEVRDTRAQQSTIAALLPSLDEALTFPSGSALEAAAPGSSRFKYRTTYLTDTLRISRPVLNLPEDLDGPLDAGGVFIYVKEE